MKKGLPTSFIEKMPTFSWTEFEVFYNLKELCQEASTLGIPAGKVPEHIAINGMKGKVAFRLVETSIYANTETVESFIYKPFNDYLEMYPGLEKWTVTIWND